MQKPLAVFLALFGAAWAWAQASAAFVPPSGLAPGSQYQLIFDTADNIEGGNADIATYNSFVTAEAALNPLLPPTTWAAVVSTFDPYAVPFGSVHTDANVNAPALGLPVYNTQGIKVADAANGLYSGSLLAPVLFDQFGLEKDFMNGRTFFVWTGSTPNGFADGGFAMGSLTYSTYGASTYAISDWISLGSLSVGAPAGVYALSGPITIVPEPSTAALLCIGIGGVVAIRRRHRHRRIDGRNRETMMQIRRKPLRVTCHAVALSGLSTITFASAPAYAQWTVTFLTPAGQSGAAAYGTDGARQVGYTYYTDGISNGIDHASLWSGSAASWVDLNPVGAMSSVANGTSGTQQVGAASPGNLQTGGSISHAGLWNGTAASWVDLNPVGSTSSVANGTSGAQQVGSAQFAGASHAGVWSGTAASWVDLNPTGAFTSVAYATSGTQQVGAADDHAGLWSGSAASWVDLNPAGAARSTALGISGTQQVGSTNEGFSSHATLWSGTAESWVDLNPAGAAGSLAYATDGTEQVGSSLFYEVSNTGPAFVEHASLWNGTADSWVDLSTYLPGTWANTYAESIWSDGTTTYIAGWGNGHTEGAGVEALLWTRTVPEPSTAALLCIGGLAVVRKRHGWSTRVLPETIRN
jgi:hypothetical protein